MRIMAEGDDPGRYGGPVYDPEPNYTVVTKDCLVIIRRDKDKLAVSLMSRIPGFNATVYLEREEANAAALMMIQRANGLGAVDVEGIERLIDVAPLGVHQCGETMSRGGIVNG